MDRLHVYEFGYKEGCSCCLNEGDRWVGLITDLDSGEFLAELRRRLPDVPLTHTESARDVFQRAIDGKFKEYPYDDPERVQMAMEGMDGVFLSRWSEYGPNISGPKLDGVHDLVDLGSIENIVAGGTWDEVAERHRVECEARRGAEEADKIERLRQADLAELERLKREYEAEED